MLGENSFLLFVWKYGLFCSNLSKLRLETSIYVYYLIDGPTHVCNQSINHRWNKQIDQIETKIWMIDGTL